MPMVPLVSSSARHPASASGSSTRGAGMRNAGSGPPRRRSSIRATSVKRKCPTYRKPPTVAATPTEPVSATSPRRSPLSRIATHGAPVLASTRASMPGSRPSRAIAKETREVTMSTALPVAAVVSSATPAIKRCPVEPSMRVAAIASGAGDAPSSFRGSTPSATNATSR